MKQKYYPLILAVISKQRVRIKIVSNKDEYKSIYSQLSQTDGQLKEITTLEALYLEKMSKHDPALTGWTGDKRYLASILQDLI